MIQKESVSKCPSFITMKNRQRKCECYCIATLATNHTLFTVPQHKACMENNSEVLWPTEIYHHCINVMVSPVKGHDKG